MSKPFPTVGIIGAGHLAKMSISAAAELGIKLLLLESGFKDLETVRNFAKQCDVISFEHKSVPMSVIKSLESDGVVVRPSSACFDPIQTVDVDVFDYVITVMVARSPHGQTTTWAPTQEITIDGDSVVTITPAPKIPTWLSEKAQVLALEIAAKAGVVGVAAVHIFVVGEELIVKQLAIGLQDSGNWSIEGSYTSQFEQHMRAILDLPLGDPSMSAQFAVTGTVVAGDKPDMYRPYLHLMARTPRLKFHQYASQIVSGQTVGHITLVGEEFEFLVDEIKHATDYMSGIIDE